MRGLPLFMWDRANFITLTKHFGQLPDIDMKTVDKEEKQVARIKVGC